MIECIADRANQLRLNENNWLVATRKKKKLVSVTGSGETSVLEGVAKQKQDFWEVAVSRLKEGTTPEQIKTHLQSKSITAREVSVFPSKIKGTVCAKVRVDISQKDEALDCKSWPAHIRVSSWLYKPKYLKKNVTAKHNEATGQNGQ